MSELSPDARDLIAQARKHGAELIGPSAEQRALLRAKLTPLWAAESSQPKAAGAQRWKLGAVALLAGLGLSSWLYSRATSEPSPIAAPLVAASASPSASAQPVNHPSPCPSAALEAAGGASPALPCAAAEARLASSASAPCAQNTTATGSAAGSAENTQRPCAQPHAAASAPGSAAVKSACVPGDVACLGRGLPRMAATPRSPKRVATRQAAATGALAAAAPAHPSAPDALPELEHQGVQLSQRASGSSVARRVQATRATAPLRAAELRTPERAVDTDTDPGPSSIDGELELLGAAQTALQKQRPSRALSMLQEHAFRFPTGAMVEERMAMQALALCALGRRQAAQTVLSNLAARGSQSQLLPRVRNQCGL